MVRRKDVCDQLQADFHVRRHRQVEQDQFRAMCFKRGKRLFNIAGQRVFISRGSNRQ
ncbi:MAG: hypothetical protein JF606_27895 [Burkholderiales bacterium]|nr:hypothetical protein [Burkholderiales bacterium]